jgi:hypothetical protein
MTLARNTRDEVAVLAPTTTNKTNTHKKKNDRSIFPLHFSSGMGLKQAAVNMKRGKKAHIETRNSRRAGKWRFVCSYQDNQALLLHTPS